ncbi:MAG: cyclophilin-like fold protein [Chloroflexota bacterium]|nr:cyclophilin-like fold protein [Dehalococcoidia bacterium]MEE3004763.1 cyclophilin-like fold protein [Chloroflexota bacterium]|tara:strand:- start:2034 stop:2408 length:375 start_codon:yes stop_codon:yes gene_type:complete
MPTNIVITAGSIRLEAELNDTFTAKAISNILPITAAANTWGDEIYFSMPITLELENGQEVVDLGDLGYWPPGGAFCIFYGLTPASQGDEIRPASAVTIIGKVQGDVTALKQTRVEQVVIEAAEA